CSIPATREISTSPSPSRRHSSRSANSRSFKRSRSVRLQPDLHLFGRRTSISGRYTVEKCGKAPQVEPFSDRLDTRGTRLARFVDERHQFAETRVGMKRPGGLDDPVPGASP